MSRRCLRREDVGSWVRWALKGEGCNGLTPGNGLSKSHWCLPPLPIWHSKQSADMVEVRRKGSTTSSTGDSSARNATFTSWGLWRSSMFRNRRNATWICVYTYSSSQYRIVKSWCICQGSQARYRFYSRFADWWLKIHWLVHNLQQGDGADIHFEKESSLLIEMNGIFENYYYLQLADTLKHILQDIFICIIKEQCSDKGKSTWRRLNGCLAFEGGQYCDYV